MITEKTNKEFIEAGMLYVTNIILQLFGWSIVYDKDNDTLYPARSKYRGFDYDSMNISYKRIGKYIKDNAEELYKECLDE